MCQLGESKSAPATVRTNSSGDSSSSSNESTSSWDQHDSKYMNLDKSNSLSEEGSSLGRTVKAAAGGVAGAVGMVAFSLWFPFFLAPIAATKTYDWAFYHYNAEQSHFDNSPWTYGTDYALTVVMVGLCMSILQYSTPLTKGLCTRASWLPLIYGLSVTAGGIAHHLYLTLESRNSASFRFLWTVCVGTVCAASIPMGLSASRAIQQFQQQPNCNAMLAKVPVAPDAFWWALGLVITAVCAFGGMSFQRPACDIFIAGITQTPSTFYMMVFFTLVDHPHVKMWAKVMGVFAFIMNAPLLPMYPLLVQYTDWSLAGVNTLLHCWLCCTWSMQAISLRHSARALTMTQKTEKTC
jgi:hypothetical protein